MELALVVCTGRKKTLYFDEELNKKIKLYLMYFLICVFCTLADDLTFTKGLKLLWNAKVQVRSTGTGMQTQGV
jgi:hypothetical protein